MPHEVVWLLPVGHQLVPLSNIENGIPARMKNPPNKGRVVRKQHAMGRAGQGNGRSPARDHHARALRLDHRFRIHRRTPNRVVSEPHLPHLLGVIQIAAVKNDGGCH